MKCFLDMDGVLADFVGGICRAHNRTCYDKPEHVGKFDMEKLWGISPKEFWRPSDNYDFWRNLEKTPEADHIYESAVRRFGLANVAILTSPSLNPFCVPAKRDWVKQHYPELAKTMIFAWGKGFIASPQHVLIDDRDRNVDDFNEAGGYGVLVPRIWNKAHKLAHISFTIVQEQLDKIKGEHA